METNEAGDAMRKRKLSWIAGLFIGFIVVCTMLSNTLLSLTLPKVAATAASKGNFVQTYRGSGILKPADERELAGPVGWQVTEVKVKKGYSVRKGQILVKYRNSEAGQQIANEQAVLKKLKLAMETLEYDYIKAAQNEDSAATLSTKAALESAKIDISTQQLQIASLLENLAANQTLKAPYDGIVSEVNVRDGLGGKAGAPDILLADTLQGYQLALQVPVGIGNSLSMGEEVDVRLLGKKSRMIQGKVARIEETYESNNGSLAYGETGAAAGARLLVVKFQDKELRGGEKVELNLSTAFQDDTILLSKAAVRIDNDGTYVYVIEERKGPLGNAFFAVRRNVKVTDANDNVAAISEGLFESEQVIVESSEPLADGNRVRL